MLKNYLLSAIRNISRNKLSSGISIFGLAIGISAAFLMFRYIQFELSFDNYHPRHERIYRLSSILSAGAKSEYLAPTAMSVAKQVQKLIDEIEVAARAVPMEAVVKLGSYQVNSKHKFYQADPEIFDILEVEWLAQENNNPLKKPNTVILTQSLADKFFEDVWYDDMLGRPLMLNRKIYSVGGVIKDIPQNSDLRFEALVSLNDSQYEWLDFQAYTYILLKKNTALSDLQLSLQNFDQHWFTPVLQEEWGTEESYVYHKAIAIADLHFTNDLIGDTEEKGNMSLIVVLSIIAIFLVTIAAINFINLFIAQSIKRNVEVGIRKVIGARKSQLVFQYLSESLLFTLISTVIAILLIQAVEPFWYASTNISLNINSLLYENIFLYLVMTLLLIGIFAGSYAAFFLASSDPVKALKNHFSNSSPKSFHKVLQLIQFSIATGMVLCTLILYQQLDFMLNKQLGYDEERLMVLSIPEVPEKSEVMSSFKQYLLDKNYAESVTLGAKPGNLYLKGTVIQEMDGNNIEVTVNAIYADADYLEVLGISLVEGNNFYRDACDCEHQYIINEALSKRLQWDRAVGESLSFDGEGEIIGVVKDFHYQSLHYAIEPLIIILNPEGGTHALVKLQGDKVGEIESAWQTFLPDIPISYSFLEQELAAQYRTEKHMIDLFIFFSILTIVISCMGLFGMSAMNAQLRTKAMGIHKVMGARRLQIFYLLSKDTLTNVGFAIVISLPLAGMIMFRWLSLFEYHVTFDWMQLFIAGSIVFLLAMFTSCYHSLHITQTNPVLSLKDE
ncbi:putative ABC transport system permease protein [Catalinimonas alkaloidigena]|uniref:ABC transporter permease n=1 Tax=Catalinimonas alkaloidigena TaxID=1075417 RepID=UPI002405D6E7|nr:ABC transporter permease [Catalinimonas alkaloidigena]MDF9797413.1 putative ABC transport system permease protein [Catalinimonas alkaloidigena]